MQVKVSKVFAKFINDTAKEMGFKAQAMVIALRYSAYEFVTGTSSLDAMDYGDYDYAHDTFSVIEVSYPDEYYACRRYLTTPELTKEFRRRGVKTTQELKEMLREMLEV